MVTICNKLVRLRTVRTAEDILVDLNVSFVDDVSTDDLERAVDDIEKRIRKAVPTARRIFIEAESLRGIGRSSSGTA